MRVSLMAFLNAPHRLALLAAALLALGGLGPWATGTWATDPVFDEPALSPRETYGGWPVSIAAIVAIAALLLVPDGRARSTAAAFTFGVAALLCAVAWTGGDYSLGIEVHVFEGWASVEPGWGLTLATAAAVLGALASLAGAPRRDPWRGAPF